MNEKTNEQLEREANIKFPYMVYHPDAEGEPPKFATWKEALAAQVKWNKECPGHVAFRRRIP